MAEAPIRAVEARSPADDVGLVPGCRITSIDGHPLRDIIDWRWYGSGDVVELGYIDTDGDTGTVELEREAGDDWGITFDGVIFDGVHQCRNNCSFCFMRQMPDDSRSSLTLRDDDFRLSFFSGTFVTFTNLTPEDEHRIIDQHLTPLRYSLHAVDPAVRRKLIGAHAPAGIAAAERLMDAGISLHAQIVLVPDENDGDVLDRTLEWAWNHPGITDIGIVPMGYTRYQDDFDRSFEVADAARDLLERIEPYRDRARRERGDVWVYAADEFYRSAFRDDLLDRLPPAADYGDYPLFEDGIGIVRAFIEDWNSCEELQRSCAEAMDAERCRVVFVSGFAQREFLDPLIRRSPLAGRLDPLYVENEYFGGNVDVTGLLCGCDIAAAIAADVARGEADGKGGATLYVLPSVIFNDDDLTLDDMTLADIRRETGARVDVVSCNASEYLAQIEALVRGLR